MEALPQALLFGILRSGLYALTALGLAVSLGVIGGGPELALVLRRATRDDLPEHRHPLMVARTEEADGPVAAEDHAVWAEGVEAVVDRGGEVLRAAARREARGDTGDFGVPRPTSVG